MVQATSPLPDDKFYSSINTLRCTQHITASCWSILYFCSVLLVLLLVSTRIAIFSALRMLVQANYFLLFCTMLTFASTVTLAGHSTRSATSTALCRVMEATSLLPDGKMIATSIRCRVRSIALLLAGPNYIAVRSYWYSCWCRLVQQYSQHSAWWFQVISPLPNGKVYSN